MLPNLALLEKINQKIKNIPNKQGEYKRKVHYCCYLLCEKAGLRVSEALNFDLSARTKKGLYQIIKTKGKKERYVYIPKQVISELKKYSWKPKQTNRFNFYHFLKRIKRELNINTKVELTPHTLRRVFATYHAENGLPLPLLQKLLGHKSIKTTALYWMNIYNENNDPDDILTAKIWPKKPRLKLKPESVTLIKVSLGELPERSAPNSLASEPPTEYLTKIIQLEQQLNQIQKENSNLKSENSNLRQDLNNLNEQNALLSHELAREKVEKEQIQQNLTNEQAKRISAENNLAQQKQAIKILQKQLQTEREINTNLASKTQANEQNYSNLQNAYQATLQEKEITQKQLNKLLGEIKKAAHLFTQWQKVNYYQQLEQQNKMQAQILQREPPPFKFK